MCDEYSFEKIPLKFDNNPMQKAFTIFLDPVLYSSESKDT